MDATIINQFVEALRPLVQPLIEAEVERQVAARMPAPVEQPRPLGIEPQRAYTRDEAAKLLSVSASLLAKREKSGRLKRLKSPRRPATYLGSELLASAGIRA